MAENRLEMSHDFLPRIQGEKSGTILRLQQMTNALLYALRPTAVKDEPTSYNKLSDNKFIVSLCVCVAYPLPPPQHTMAVASGGAKGKLPPSLSPTPPVKKSPLKNNRSQNTYLEFLYGVVWLPLKNHYLDQVRTWNRFRKWYFRASKFKKFLGEQTPLATGVSRTSPHTNFYLRPCTHIFPSLLLIYLYILRSEF